MLRLKAGNESITSFILVLFYLMLDKSKIKAPDPASNKII